MRKLNEQLVTSDDVLRYKKGVFNLLLTFTNFLDKNGINYVLYAGTLLGAVRHKGFIPWDDDVDLLIDYNGYEKLKSLKEKFKNDRYDIVFPLEKNSIAYPRAIKVYDNNVVIKECGNKCYSGLFIDVFFAMDFKCKPEKIVKYLAKYRFLTTAYSYKTRRTELKTSTTRFKRIIKIISFFMTASYIKRKIETYHLVRNKNNDFFVSSFGSPKIFKKTYFSDTVMLEFEGHMFRAPAEYDTFLTQSYGDYMTPPKQEDRNPIHMSSD